MLTQNIETWPVDKLVPYARNPRKNDKAVDRMCSSIREFGFKIPVLARSNGEVVAGHLRLKAAHKLGIAEVPVILCDEWTPAQVKAFRLMVNRSVTWAAWDEELLALEMQEIQHLDFDLALTGFDPRELDELLNLPEEEAANEAPPLPVVAASRTGDLWLCGKHRVLCGDATIPEAVARLLENRKPKLMVTDPADPPSGLSAWRYVVFRSVTASSRVSGPPIWRYMRVPVRRSTFTTWPAPLSLTATFDATMAPTWSPGVASAGTVMVIGIVACLPGSRTMPSCANVTHEPTSTGTSSPASRSNSPSSLLKASVA